MADIHSDSDQRDEDKRGSTDIEPVAPPAEPPHPDRKTRERARKDDRAAMRPIEGPVSKMSKRQRRHMRDMHRPLDSWERYRALTDMVEELLDLVDLADHKARFALIIMGALNAFLFILASETDAFEAIPPGVRPALTAFLVVYGLMAVYFVVQAIESLRPRKAQPRVLARREDDLEDLPLGLRFHEDALRYSVDEYRNAWRDLRIGQLNSELAVQAHALHQINTAKYGALRRLYLGLMAMTVMAAVMLAAGTYFVLSGKADETRKKAAEDLAASAAVIADLGVKEPSGVAYHAARKRFYVVGDDGSMAELDESGKRVRTFRIDKQTEDVAVHAPSGLLVLVNEGKSELVVFDLDEGRAVRSVPIDAAGVLGQSPREANQGFEGLGFRSEAGRAGGGVFYLAHQRAPAMIAAIAFDPSQPPAQIGADSVVERWDVNATDDLTAVVWSDEMDRLLVVADSEDAILVMSANGRVRGELRIPGEQQEGLAIGPDGAVWIADDKQKQLLRVAGGLQSLPERRHTSKRSMLLL